jgi:ornithine cyclodeaminase/alanine dehydrogenase-like protein (mu-crystallin family)
MDTLVLTGSDVAAIAAAVSLDRLMDEVIAELTSDLRLYHPATTRIYPRRGFEYQIPRVGLLEWMPLLESGRTVVLKVVGYHPANPPQGLPTVLGTIHVYDATNGHLAAIVDGVLATALRTGAASAVASRVLANPASRVLGIIGCGMQAVTQLHAIQRAFHLTEVLVHDLEPEVALSFIDRTSFAALPIRVAAQEEIERRCDILCTATSVPVGEGPVVSGRLLQPWLHVNAVGSDFPGKTELPVSVLRQALVCPDFREQAVCEGECQQLTAHEIGPSLDELVREPASFASWRERLTVFDSTGFALEDKAVVDVLLAHARELEIGTRLQLEGGRGDPRDPFAMVKAISASSALPREAEGVIASSRPTIT